MRRLQAGLFLLGLLAFLAAGVAAGTDLGDTLWRTGIAVLLVDLVAIKLWPAPRMPRAA